MRATEANTIIEAFPGRLGFIEDGEDFFPVVDGALLPEPARDLFGRGEFNRVPIIAGINEDEGSLFTLLVPVPSDGVLETELRLIGLLFGLDRDGLVDLYDADDFESPNDAFDAFYSDAVFICPTRAFLQAVAPHTPTRGYRFSRGAWFLEDLGAYHAHELGYVFGTLPPLLYGAADQDLSDLMQSSWVDAARGSPAAGGESWPTYETEPDGGSWMNFDVPTALETGVHDAYCDWFDGQGWQAYP